MPAPSRPLLIAFAPLLAVLVTLTPALAQAPAGQERGQEAPPVEAPVEPGQDSMPPAGDPGNPGHEPRPGAPGEAGREEAPPAPDLAGEAAPPHDEAVAHGGHDEPVLNSATGVVRRVAAGETRQERVVTVEITSGEFAGKTVTVVQRGGGPQGLELPVGPGDAVVLTAVPLEDAHDFDWQIVDYQRARTMLAIGALTGLLLVVLGGWRGLKTLAVLGVTALAIGGILLPLTLRGWSPLPLAVLLAAAISVSTTLLTSGPGRKTWAAVAGTIGAVALSALIAAVFVTWGRLSGLASEEALMAHASHGAIDAPGLLAASVLVGSLGVVLDLSLSIAAAVDELRRANPGMPRRALLEAGWEVGRDLLSTTSNTLLLAYLGGFLPVLLSLGVQPIGAERLWHLETIVAFATTLGVGLCGLVLAIPLTAFIAARMAPPASGRLQATTTET